MNLQSFFIPFFSTPQRGAGFQTRDNRGQGGPRHVPARPRFHPSSLILFLLLLAPPLLPAVEFYSPHSYDNTYSLNGVHHRDILHIYTSDPAYVLRVEFGSTNLHDGAGDRFYLNAETTPAATSGGTLTGVWSWDLFISWSSSLTLGGMSCSDPTLAYSIPRNPNDQAFDQIYLQGYFYGFYETQDAGGAPVQTPVGLSFYFNWDHLQHYRVIALDGCPLPMDGGVQMSQIPRGWLAYRRTGQEPAQPFGVELHMCCALAVADCGGGTLLAAPGNPRTGLFDAQGNALPPPVSVSLAALPIPEWWDGGYGYMRYAWEGFVAGLLPSESEGDAPVVAVLETPVGTVMVNHTYTVAGVHLCGDYTGDGEITPEDEYHKDINTPFHVAHNGNPKHAQCILRYSHLI